MNLGSFGRRTRRGACVLLLALGTLVPGCRERSAEETLQSTAAELPARFVEGRLSGFAYAPRRTVTRGADDLSLMRLRSVAAGILASHAERAAHTTGVAMLLYGEPARAVAELQAVPEKDPTASYWNDLAVARLEAAVASDDAHESAQALVAVDRALALDARNPEALFNRALALDALGLRFAAIDAWKHFLSVDGASGWAVEARARLALDETPTREEAWKFVTAQLERALDTHDGAASRAFVRSFPQQARRWGEGVYLPQWGEAVLAGDTARAIRELSRVHTIAAALQQLTGDTFLADVASATDARPSLAPAYVAYRDARVAYARRRIADALPRFVEAEHLFASVNHPMAPLVAAWRAHALLDLGDATAAETIANRLQQSSHRPVQAQQWWLRTRLASNAGRQYEALVATRKALELFQGLGDLDHVARLRTNEAAMLVLLGRDADAWRARRAALEEAAASGKANLVETALEAIIREEMSAPSTDIARSLLGVQIAVPSTLPLMRFEALLARAALETSTSSRPEDISNARAALDHIPDPKQRTDAVDELRLLEAMQLVKNDPAEAERLLGETIEYRTRNDLLAYLPTVYRIRAEARRRLGSDAAAENDLRLAIAMIESRHRRIAERTYRDSYLGNFADAYNALIDLLLDRGAWRDAFTIAERQRSANAIDVARLVSAAPRGAIVAHYTALPTRTLLVILEHGQATHYVVPIGVAKLVSLRDDFVQAIEQRRNADANRLSRRLYELLITPLLPRLAGNERLIVVPDEAIYGIPFAALGDAHGRFLIEDVQIEIGQTSEAILATEPEISANAAVTIVADPAFSSELFPQLARLPDAHRDARILDRIFPQSTLLAGGEATRQAFFRTAPGSDLMHIGAHAFSSSRDASLSLIALSAGDRDDGVLYLRDIAGMELRRRPTVILAGCHTGSLGGGKGSTRSLAHAFLSAGSRSVIGTLWDIDDAAASALMTTFYRNLANGVPAAAALRRAQLDTKNRPVRDWGAYQIHIAK